MKKNSLSRRNFLKLSALGLGGILLFERSYDFLSESKAEGKIVIVGGGAAGITMAAYLVDKLRTPDITIIEPNEIHHYQPGYTMIAGGEFKANDILMPNKDFTGMKAKCLHPRCAISKITYIYAFLLLQTFSCALL